MYILLTGHVEVLTKDPEPLYISFENEAAVLDYKEEDVTIFLQATPTNTIIPTKTNEETHEIIPVMTVYEVLLLKSVFNTDKPGFIFGQDALLQGKPRYIRYPIYIYIYIFIYIYIYNLIEIRQYWP